MLTVTEPALLIRIPKLYRPDISPHELYEATRGVWRLGRDKERAEYALCIANGVVQEVYKIDTWYPAGETGYETRPLTDVAIPGRWEFSGTKATEAVCNKYVGRSIAHYFRKGNVNPVCYVNIKRN